VRKKVWRHTREEYGERPSEQTEEELSRIFTSWNHLDRWLRAINELRCSA
jgi:hypothetical protein